jgi:hypothetical protein
MGTDWFRDCLEGPLMKFAIPPHNYKVKRSSFDISSQKDLTWVR